MNNFLILVKHSLPEIRADQPARTWHLSREGIVLANRLADRLSTYQLQALASSSEPKAAETAQFLATSYKLPVDVIPDLREHDRSEVGFLSKEEFQHSVHEFFRQPNELIFGNETANQAHSRFYKATLSILETNQNKTIAIVSHGTVISLFVSRLTGISDYSLWKELGLPSFVVLDMQSRTLITKENIS